MHFQGFIKFSQGVTMSSEGVIKCFQGDIIVYSIGVILY